MRMPKAYLSGSSNHLLDLEPVPDEVVLEEVNLEEQQDAEDAEVASSVGTSFSPSETKQDKSGGTTTSDLQSPAPDAENLSDKDPSPAPDPSPTQASSSADSTVGSTQETGSGQPSQQSSSEDAGSPSSKRTKRS